MKNLDCPNCGGRSFDAIDPHEYSICKLCEQPESEFIQWYSKKWPEAYAAFMSSLEKKANEDPHADKLQKTADEWADKDYRGLYAFPLDGRTYVARMRWMREGMGREFFDPESGDYIGFCGSKFANQNIKEIVVQ